MCPIQPYPYAPLPHSHNGQGQPYSYAPGHIHIARGESATRIRLSNIFRRQRLSGPYAIPRIQYQSKVSGDQVLISENSFQGNMLPKYYRSGRHSRNLLLIFALTSDLGPRHSPRTAESHAQRCLPPPQREPAIWFIAHNLVQSAPSRRTYQSQARHTKAMQGGGRRCITTSPYWFLEKSFFSIICCL